METEGIFTQNSELPGNFDIDSSSMEDTGIFAIPDYNKVVETSDKKEIPAQGSDVMMSDSYYSFALKNFSEEEIDNLRRERQKLILKKFSKTITSSETKRIEYIEWQIDRYETAIDQHSVAKVENVISQHRQALDKILKSIGL